MERHADTAVIVRPACTHACTTATGDWFWSATPSVLYSKSTHTHTHTQGSEFTHTRHNTMHAGTSCRRNESSPIHSESTSTSREPRQHSRVLYCYSALLQLRRPLQVTPRECGFRSELQELSLSSPWFVDHRLHICAWCMTARVCSSTSTRPHQIEHHHSFVIPDLNSDRFAVHHHALKVSASRCAKSIRVNSVVATSNDCKQHCKHSVHIEKIVSHHNA